LQNIAFARARFVIPVLVLGATLSRAQAEASTVSLVPAVVLLAILGQALAFAVAYVQILVVVALN